MNIFQLPTETQIPRISGNLRDFSQIFHPSTHRKTSLIFLVTFLLYKGLPIGGMDKTDLLESTWLYGILCEYASDESLIPLEKALSEIIGKEKIPKIEKEINARLVTLRKIIPYSDALQFDSKETIDELSLKIIKVKLFSKYGKSKRYLDFCKKDGLTLQ